MRTCHKKPEPSRITVDPVEVWACNACNGDQHADWVCPECGEKNTYHGMWESDADMYRHDNDDKCEWCKLLVTVSGKWPE